MDWDDLRYVLAIARQGNLSRAASHLGVTRTTVGRRLRAIESALGVRLFDRTPEGFSPTAAGQDMCDVADQMEADVLSLEGRVLGRDVQLEGKLRVSTIDFQFAFFHEAFASFVVRYPRVDLTVSMSNETVSLTRREADVALRLTSAPPAHLVGRKVAEVRYAAYGNKGLVERIGRDAPYAAFPWLHLDERMNPRRLNGWLAENAPGARIAMRLDSANSIREAIRAGIGVQLLATYDGDADPNLVRIGAIQDDPHGLWLLTLPELRATSRVRAFMEHMVDALRVRLSELEAHTELGPDLSELAEDKKH
ncbi:MAG: LysR family transcriptional regulator [Rhodobacterales bacterium]|nr:LysR family transcriptional regulator [Rhodobacterales bacterium]